MDYDDRVMIRFDQAIMHHLIALKQYTLYLREKAQKEQKQQSLITQAK